jgi:hypothetical protein
MMSKVYCRGCAHFIDDDAGEACGAAPKFDSYYSPYRQWVNPRIKNGNNDCADYQASGWERFYGWLRRVFGEKRG